jgi:hypothetical protein
MDFHKHKHTAVAALVAPILAILAYYAVDSIVGEKPHAAKDGESYPLVEKPGCRYAGGECALWNGDFELDVSLTPTGEGRTLLAVSAPVALEGIRVAIAAPGAAEQEPIAMQQASADGLRWSLQVATPEAGKDQLRLVASSGGTLYFGEFSTAFIAPPENY